MNLRKKFLSVGALFAMALSPLGFAAETDSDVQSQIVQQIQDNKGLIVKVPLDQNGQPIDDQAAFRVVTGDQEVTLSPEGMEVVFERALDISSVPRLDGESLEPEFFPGLALLGLGVGLAAANPYFYGPRFGYYGWGRPYGYYRPYYYPGFNYGYYYYPPYRPWY